jgi:hypothetical protein
MGFFSWNTQDTNKSIANHYSTRRTFKVYMIDDKGNKWEEDNYDGYGVFGGKDYFELLAEMNGVLDREIVSLEGEAYTDYMRGRGIELAFHNNPSGYATEGVLYPNLTENANWPYDKSGPESCNEQGFFYGDEENQDGWDDEEDYEN